MNDQLNQILRRHQVSAGQDAALVNIAAGAAGGNKSAAALVESSAFTHPRDKAVAAAIVDAVRAGRRRLLWFTFAATAVPLCAVIAFVVSTEISKVRSQDAIIAGLQQDHQEMQARLDRQIQDYREVTQKAAANALSVQQNASAGTQALASNFTQAMQSQVKEIAALTAENAKLKEQLEHPAVPAK